MKIKKLVPIIALIMGLSTLGGCTNSDQKIMFGALWNEHVNADKPQIHETLQYDVSFEAAESSLVGYKLNYKDGSYTTTLVGAEENGEFVYTYTTNLSIVAQYSLGTATAEFTDTVTSEVKFKAANYGLQPISSKKEFLSHSPESSTSSTLENCYRFYHFTVETNYTSDCTEGKSVIVNYPVEGDPVQKETSFEIDQDKYTYLDNEQLLAALRCIRNTTTSAKVNVYSPLIDATQKVSLTFAADASQEFTLSKNGAEAKKETLTYRPVSVVLDERNPGATQTAWIAKYEDVNGYNKHRNVLLYLETPLSYGLGTLKYTLRSISYQE